MHSILPTLLPALLASLTAAQTLSIPSANGAVQTLNEPITVSGAKDYANAEFDRGVDCPTNPPDTGNDNAVFVLEDGATLSNVIIGAKQLEGVRCMGRCTLKNVWFRDVCEDAITINGPGDALIEGGGANGGDDKTVQHNGIGTVTIRGGTYTNGGKLYRSCGNCSGNKSRSPRKVVIENVQVNGFTSELAGINVNYGDTATISGVCGSNAKKACQEWTGVEKGGSSTKVTSTGSCLGAQGKLTTLPTC